MGRKKAVVKQKKTPVTPSIKKSSSVKSSIKKIKDLDRCKEWLIEQKNTTHETVPIHDINDEENSVYDNEMYRKMEPEEKSKVCHKVSGSKAIVDVNFF